VKCPVDKEILTADKAEVHSGFGCLTCKGSWLPKKYIDSLKYTKEFDPQQFWQELTKKPSKSNDSKCPSNCGALHKIEHINGVSYCPKCNGMWFESGCLKVMVNKYRTKKDALLMADAPSALIGLFSIFSLFK